MAKFKMEGHTLPGINQRIDKSSKPDGRAKSSVFQKDDKVAMKGLLPEVTVKDKKDKITLAKPTKEELAKAKRRGGETSGGLTANVKTNETTGKSEMVTVVSNKEKADALQAAQDKVFAYNKANKGKPGYVRQTFAKNISKDNKYIN
jgi:hypothetical protein